MNYEEKRELRLQISQMLADAGLNQKVIKDMVEQEIENKVKRAIDQVMTSLDSKSYSGDFVVDSVRARIKDDWNMRNRITEAVKEVFKDRVIQVSIEKAEITGE